MDIEYKQFIQSLIVVLTMAFQGHWSDRDIGFNIGGSEKSETNLQISVDKSIALY